LYWQGQTVKLTNEIKSVSFINGRQYMAKATKLNGSSRTVCDGSLQKSPHEAGTKNPCIVCGRMTTTKREGVQRRHTAKKIKQEA
jgi:hypothetical protein